MNEFGNYCIHQQLIKGHLLTMYTIGNPDISKVPLFKYVILTIQIMTLCISVFLFRHYRIAHQSIDTVCCTMQIKATDFLFKSNSKPTTKSLINNSAISPYSIRLSSTLTELYFIPT